MQPWSKRSATRKKENDNRNINCEEKKKKRYQERYQENTAYLPATHTVHRGRRSSSTAREPCLKGSWTVHLYLAFSRPGEHWAWLAVGAKGQGCPPRSPDGGEFTAALPLSGLQFLSMKNQETGQAVSAFELARVKPQLECSNGKMTTFFFFFNNLSQFITRKIFNFT